MAAKRWHAVLCGEIRASVAVARISEPDARFVNGFARNHEAEDNHVASGRAKCPCCGKRIAAGAKCLRVVYVGGEPWLSNVRFLHASECT